jgi:hypothetical protein
VTLDSENWQSGVSLIVSPVDDAVADGERTCLVEIGAASSNDAGYAGLAAGDVTVTVTDDDTAGIAVAPTSLTVAEPADSTTFTLTLSSEPLDPVTISLTPSNEQCSLSVESVTLDSENWRGGVSVTVSPVDDAVADGEQSCLVQTGPASSGGADYAEIVPDDVTVTVIDNDTVGILIAPRELSLSEPEGSATFAITLGSQPTATVVIRLASEGQTAVAPAELSFTEVDWRAPVSVTISAVDDYLAEGQHGSVISPTVSSQDGHYDGFALASITVVIADNDRAGVVVTPTRLLLAEGDPPQGYQVALGSQPAEPVSITVTTDPQMVVTPTLLTFGALEWPASEMVMIAAVDDILSEEPVSSTISHTISTTDRNYAGLVISDVVASVVDNDIAVADISPAERTGTGALPEPTLAPEPTAEPGEESFISSLGELDIARLISFAAIVIIVLVVLLALIQVVLDRILGY